MWLSPFLAIHVYSCFPHLQCSVELSVFLLPRCRRSCPSCKSPKNIQGSAQALCSPALWKNLARSPWSRFRNRRCADAVPKLAGQGSGNFRNITVYHKEAGKGRVGVHFFPLLLCLPACITFNPHDRCLDSAAFVFFLGTRMRTMLVCM